MPTSEPDRRPRAESAGCREEAGESPREGPWENPGGATASRVADYVAADCDPPGVEIEYRDDDGRRSRRLYGCVPIERTFDRPAARSAIRCFPVDPDEGTFTVALEAVEDLTGVDLPKDVFREVAGSASGVALGLRRFAACAPEDVPLPPVIGLLEGAVGDDVIGGESDSAEACGDDEVVTRRALAALSTLAAARPAEATAAIPVLRQLLARGDANGDGDRITTWKALETIRLIAASDPGAVAPMVDDLVPYLDASPGRHAREAARALGDVAAGSPTDVSQAVPALAGLVEEDQTGQAYAAYALSQVSRENPAAIEPVAPVLGQAVVDDSRSVNTRLSAAAAFGRTVGERPAIGVEFVEDLVALFGADDHRLRNNAVGIVGDVARTHTDVVEPYVADLAPLLAADDDFTRVNASGAISRVAEDFPDSVSHLSGRFATLLDDEESLVRLNACWALGYLEADGAVEALADVAHEDDDQAVRNRAAWAHARIRS